MSCNSSSSEDDLERLKEAVDGSFLPQHLYEIGKPAAVDLEKRHHKHQHHFTKCEIWNQVKGKKLNQNHQKTSVNPFTVKVTPEFQKHVSKRLSRLLDEIIDDIEITPKRKKSKMQQLNSGIKLLNSSKNFLMLSDHRETHVNLRNIYKKKSSGKIDFEERSKEVAVSPEWVLSKEEVRHWAPETKGELEIVKLDGVHNKFNFSKKKIIPTKHR